MDTTRNTNHDHGRVGKDADGHQKRAAVAHRVLLGGQEHDVAADGDEAAHGHDRAAGSDVVREKGGPHDDKEGGHVGWHREQLGDGVLVAETSDDGRQEKGKALRRP